jgi:hypothetical protein
MKLTADLCLLCQKTAQSALDNREPGKQSDLVDTRV